MEHLLWKTVWQLLNTLDRVTRCPGNSTLGYILKRIGNRRSNKYLHTDVHSSETHDCREAETTKMSIGRWTDEHRLALHTVQCRLAIRGNEALHTLPFGGTLRMCRVTEARYQRPHVIKMPLRDMFRAGKSRGTESTSVGVWGGARWGVTAEWVGVLFGGDEKVLELGSGDAHCEYTECQ